MLYGAALGEQGAAAGWVVILGWVAGALGGFDLVVLGAVTPALLEIRTWGQRR